MPSWAPFTARPADPIATAAASTCEDGTSTLVPPAPSFEGIFTLASAACTSPASRGARFVNAGT